MSAIGPTHQTNWDWRAAGNFLGGGAGASLMIFAALASLDNQVLWPAGLLGIVLVGIGLFTVWLEIGRPWRALHVFFHPQTSWMTRESFVALPMLAVAAIGVLLGLVDDIRLIVIAPVFWVAALFAAGYLACQASILYASKGIPAWRHKALFPVIVLTGLAEGAGLGAALLALFAEAAAWAAIGLGVLCLIREIAWRWYLHRLTQDGAPKGALTVLRRARNPVLVLGLIVPVVLIAVALLVPAHAGRAMVVAGFAAVAGGWWLKYVVIARAAFNQGFALPKLPIRGQGRDQGRDQGRAKGGPGGPATQPGWERKAN